MGWSRADHEFMQRALRLARRGAGRVEPNPMVGCVIVKRGRIIGEGYHRRFGGPHAEVDALRRCTTSPRGATVYVTLEPCCFHGKTPACTDALLTAGVARVVAGVTDPNPRVSGAGLRLLNAAGIDAAGGLCIDEASALIAPFRKLITTGRPWVILKWAQSLDGKIATRTGDSKWITDEQCRAHAHRTRGRVDAIIVGVETVLHDDPLLTARHGRPRRIARRVVLDSRLRTPRTAKVVTTARACPTLIFCGKDAPQRRTAALTEAGCEVMRVNRTRRGLSLTEVLKSLGQRLVTNVLVEGGGRVLGGFFDAGLADEIHAYVAPLLIGGRGASGPLHGAGSELVTTAPRLPRDAMARRLGDGWLIAGRLGD